MLSKMNVQTVFQIGKLLLVQVPGACYTPSRASPIGELRGCGKVKADVV